MSNGERNLWLKLPGGRLAPFRGYALPPGELPIGHEFKAREQRQTVVARTMIRGTPAVRVRVVSVEQREVQFPRTQIRAHPMMRTVYHVEVVEQAAAEKGDTAA